jgi:hypothetical protein
VPHAPTLEGTAINRDAIVIGIVLLALAATALLVLWLQQDEPPQRPVVEALAGPQPEYRPPARDEPP